MKIRQSYVAKANKGEYVCGHPPFGYLRSKTERNQLVIDEGADVIIRRIFDMACEGLSCTKIATALNDEGVDTALAWRKRNGRSTLGIPTDEDGRTYWVNSQVLRIVRDERYTGTLICFKSARKKVGDRRQVKQPESEWLKIPNSYEAIVTSEKFAEANAKLRTNKKHNAHGIAAIRSPFTSKIICGHCNRAMRQQNSRQPYHYCTGVKLKKGKGCYDGKVYYDDIKEVVLSVVKAEAQKVYDVQQRRRQTVSNVLADKNIILDEMKQLSARIANLERRGFVLYENFALGKLGKDEYIAEKDANRTELSNVETRSAELTSQLNEFAEPIEAPNDEPLLRRVLEADDISEEVLSLVDCIVVYDSTRIEVKLAFSDTNI